MKSDPYECRGYSTPDPLAGRLAFAAALVVFVTVAMVGAALVMEWLS